MQSRLAWFLATSSEARLRDASEATRHAQRAVDLSPEDGAGWNALGVARCRTGDWKGSIEALKRSLELRLGGDPNDWLFLAVDYRNLGDSAEGRSWYDAAVEWMDAHAPVSAEMNRFRAETESALGIPADPGEH
jgi:predicted Zn-dependent protease